MQKDKDTSMSIRTEIAQHLIDSARETSGNSPACAYLMRAVQELLDEVEELREQLK